MIGEMVVALIVLYLVSLYAMLRSGAREDERKARLLKRLHEEMAKRR